MKFVALITLSLWFLGGVLIVHHYKERPGYKFPAYCIDPFASEDLGQTVYTPCSLVPMWSIKV